MDTSPSLWGIPPRSPTDGERTRVNDAGLRRISLGAALLACSGAASAFTIGLAATAPKTAYLQVGVGSFTNGTAKCTYNGTNACYHANNGQEPNGQPQNNATINIVSTTVPSTAVGNGNPQTMTTDSAAANSYYDGYTFCTVPGQLYIGGFYRTATGNTAAATVTATVPAALTDAAGDSIPFSKISWT